jgi:hypothetical protein
MLFHVWMLPLIILPGAAGSMRWTGDEHGALVGANLPAILLIWVLPERWLKLFLGAHFLLLVSLTLIVLASIGLVMDRLRVWRWIYILIPPLFLAMVVSKSFVPGNVPPVPYTRGREWQPDSLCVAWSWCVYALAACVLAPVLLVRIAKSLRRLIARRGEIV